jgi:hypothetical protein
MLAYVFWHTPQTGVEPAEYERMLVAFHEALADSSPAGFRHSAAFRLGEVPWLPSEGSVYEDWYLVEGSAALDTLNDAAVTAHRQVPHDQVAAVAGTGAGGLYRLRQGDAELHSVRAALWLSKQPAQSYPEFYAEMELATSGKGAALWGRQMVLGPAPEFCLHTVSEVKLDRFISRRVPIELIWCGEAAG